MGAWGGGGAWKGEGGRVQRLKLAYLPAFTQQLIVDSNGRDPLALSTPPSSTDGQQRDEVSSALVGVESQARCIDAVDVALGLV